jgi:hypothetical protein
VLQQAALRRFSSPTTNKAAGGIASAETQSARPASSAAPLFGGTINLPGGTRAPTASNSTHHAPDAPAGGPGAPAGALEAPDDLTVPTPRRTVGDDWDAAQIDALTEQKAVGAAAGLVASARNLKSRGDTAAMRAAAGAEAAIMRQLTIDQKVDAGIRSAIERLSRSGRPVTREDVEEAAEDVLSANGLTPEDVDLPIAIARADGPPLPDIPPDAYVAAVKALVSAPPLDAATQAELQNLADKPPPPHTPAPQGALEAYREHRDVFDKALKDFGVKPEHILSILGVETRWGRNTGKFPVQETLRHIVDKNKKPKKVRQAVRDISALIRLGAAGDLGGKTSKNIRGSYAGAIGISQFVTSSWDAYSRSPYGGKRDPYDFDTAAYSTAHYLKVHNYSRDVPRAIWGYNHSSEYVNTVLALSDKIKAGLPDAPSK